MPQTNQPTVAFHTLGCKVNQHDSDVMAALFEGRGYRVVPFQEKADVYVVNTCTVTHLSDKKSRQMLRRATAKNPEAIVVASGCYAQSAPDDIKALTGVDIIIGTNERHKIVDAVEAHQKSDAVSVYLPSREDMMHYECLPHERVSNMTRAYVKIEEGCNQFCSYCIIPHARGPVRSRPMADTLADISRLANSGYKEVILTGIHIGMYGTGRHDEGISLYELCQHIIDETAIERLRLGSIECTEITPELIALAQEEPRFAKHFHVPLQAGCDRTLRHMKRPYTCDDFRRTLINLRKAIPNVAITTDLMVGFPGETDADFAESLSFADEMAFSDMHIFKYSPRKNTPAAKMAHQVPAEVKEARSHQMLAMSLKNRDGYLAQHVGQTLSVLMEEKGDNGRFRGHTSNYLLVEAEGQTAGGHFEKVAVDDYGDGVLFGRIV